MIWDDLLRLAIAEIKFHKIQSLLIIAAVAVGIFAIFTLNSLGTGLKETFTDIMGKFGSDIAIVMSGSLYSFENTVTEQDLRELSSIPAVVGTCPVKFNVEFIKGKLYWIMGMTMDCYEWISDHGLYEIEKGDFGVAAGYIMAEDLELDVNSAIEIKDKKFRITGILKPIGSEQDDSSLYMTLPDFDRIYGDTDYYMVFVQFVGEPENLEQAVDNEFRDKKLQVLVYQQMMQQVTSMLDTLNVALIGVAFISLIVGSITIANTVYATIKRRTKEIGMLKAVGAKDRDVMVIFLIETFILSSIGGIVGIVSGYAVAFAISEAIKKLVLFKPSINPVIVLGSLLIAVLIGPISALIPSLYAARLSPTEALRYE